MIKAETIIEADFCRDTPASIRVFLKGRDVPISFFKNNIEYNSRKLSKNEIDTVIQILLSQKEIMSRKGDFPYAYDEMLSDLITVYKERYGKQDWKGKNWKNHYTLSINQLEELLKERYKFKGIRFDLVTAGRKDSPMTKVEVGSDGILFVSFREAKEDV